MLVTKLRLIGIGSLVVPTLLGAASIAVADEVTVKLVVADRTTNNSIDAAIYSFQTCATYKEFQRQQNILTDGVLGPDTMKVLAKASSPDVIQGYVLRASTVVGCDQEKNLRSLALNQPATVTFTNHTEEVRRLYWLNHNGERVLYATLQPGMVFQAQTYITHPWVVADASDKCRAIYMPTSDANDIALNR
jgi:hypothetical protein